MALFSTGRQQATSQYLVEFRAGKMFTRGGGETGAPIMVHPDKRKGMVYVTQSDDGLMHFCWKDRTNGTVEDDLIVFPDDVEFVRVDQCTTGRVFLLKFKNSPRKLFFWMQEPKADKDEEYRKKVNDLLNSPPVPGSSGRGHRGMGAGHQDGSDQFAMMNQLLGLGGSSGGGSEERMDLQNALQGMDQQQLMQLLNLMGGSSGGGGMSGMGGFGGFSESGPAPSRNATTAPPPVGTAAAAAPPTASTNTTRNEGSATSGRSTAASTTAPTGGAASTGGPSANNPPRGGAATTDSSTPQLIQVNDLRNILANLGGGGGQVGEQAIDLESILTARNIEESVRQPQNEARLLPHLPDEAPIERNRQELLQTIRSPQFRQAVDMFGSALQTGQLAPLMSQFDVSHQVIEACTRGDIQSMAELLANEGGAGASAGGAPAAVGAPSEKDKEKKDTPDAGGKKDKKDDEGMDLD